MSDVTIHQYNDYGYYTGNSMVIDERGAIPPYWTDAPFPEVPSGEYAVFRAGSWFLTSDPQPPPSPELPPSPVPGEMAAVSNELPASVSVI